MKPENLRFTRNFLCSLLFLVVLIQRAQAADQVPVTLTLRYEESAAHPGAKQPVREGGITGAVEDVSKKINSPGDVGSGKIAAQLVLRLMPVVETSVDGSSLARLDVTQVSWTLPTGLSAEAAGQVRLDRINVIDRLKQWRSSIPSTPRVTVNGVGGHSLPLELAFVDLRRLRSPPSSVFVAVDATPANYLFTWLVDDRFGATRLASQSPVGSIVRLRARIRGGIAPDRIDVPVRIFHADGKRESRTLRLDRLAAGTTLESAPMRLTAKTAPPADAMYALGGTRLEAGLEGPPALLDVIAPPVEVRFVQLASNGTYVPAQEPLVFGQPFFIEAQIGAPKPESSLRLDISWAAGQVEPFEVHLTRDDPLLYRSREIRLLPPIRKGQ